MGSPKELLRGALVGFWAWLLCGIATGAALPVSTQHPAIEDDYSTPNFLSTVIFADYFGPTLPTTTEEDLDFPAETPFPSETNGETPKAVGEGETSSSGEPPNSGLPSSEDDSGSLTSTPKTFKIPEDLKETLEVPSVDKSVLAQVNSSEPTLGKETLQGDPLAESQEASKETPPPDLDAGHEATELITERYSGITDAPVTLLATLEEDFLTSSPREEAQSELSSESPPEGDKPLENIPEEPNLEEELKPTSTAWEETEGASLEAEKDAPEPSTDESRTLEDPPSNSTVFPSTPEDLPDQGTEENVDAGDQPSLSSEGNPKTTQSSTGFPVDSASLEGRGDTDPIPSSSGPELNRESPVNLTSEEPEDFVDAEAPNSSPSDRTTDAPSDSGPPGDTLVRTSQLDASDIPLMGFSVTPEIPSQLPEDGEVETTSTVEEEGEEDSGNPKSNEGTSLVSSLPGQESAQGTEIPDEERSADLLRGTASSLNPGVETANSELEDSEATTTSNSVPEDEINPISSDLATVSENESGALFDTTAGSPPPVDNEGADKAQEPPAETQGSTAEASAPASTDGPSSETEGNEALPSGSPGNIGSSLDEVDTEANNEDGSGSDLSPPGSTNEPSSEREGSEALPSGSSGNMSSSSEKSDTIPSVSSDEVDTQANGEDRSVSDLPPPDTELSSISGTPQPMGRSGTLNDPLSPSQSLIENALTPGSSFSSEGEPTFPSTSPDEALSGALVSEPDATELSSNSLPGSQPSSQLSKENDMETDSVDVEDSPPPLVDNQGAAKAQGPPAEASVPGSTNEPSSEREGSEVLPSGSPGNMGSPSENSDTIPSVSSDDVDTQANGEDRSVSDLPPSDTELSPIFGTPLPMGRSGTLNDQPSPSQSLVENALTPGSSFSSEGEPTFPSTSPDEALSGALVSEPDATELPSNSLPGSQPSSQLPKENDMETSSGDLEGPPTEASAPGSTNEPSSVREGSEVLPSGSPEGSQPSSQVPEENDMETGSGDIEDSPPPPVDNQGAAKAQGPPAEASAPGSTNEPSSEREGSEVLPSGSPGNMGSPSENSDTIPSVSSDDVDTQANGEDRSVSDLPPSETELSSISETPLATSSQPPKEDDTETHSEVPEDSVSIDGEETSSAPSVINPQSALAEATEEPSISGDLSDGPIVSPKEERIGSTSEPGVNEEPLLDGDNTQDKINTPPSEQQLGSEDALETSIPSSGDESAIKSGTISPLVDTETSTKTQEPSGETSSASNSENEDGEPSPSLSSKTLDSSPGSEVVDESRDGEDDTGSASSAKTAVTVSNDGQPGSDFPVGQLVTSPVGGILALAPIEDGEASVPRDDAQLSTGAVSSEDATPQSASSSEGTETSASEPSAVGSQPSPDDEAAPETSKVTEQTSAASEKVSPLASSTAESQEPTTSESGAVNKESPAFPVEVAGTANSPPATDKSSQFLPEGAASSDGVEDSEDITNTISEISSQGPLNRGSKSKTSTSEEGTEGRSDGELSLNNNGTETATVESANNGGSQLLPDGAQPSTTIGTSEISEGASSVNGQEGSLIPSAAESHSISTEEVENANLESGTQPSLDGSPTTEVQDSKSAEAAEDTSNNGEKSSLTLSATASKSPGISDSGDVSGGTGEELEMTGSGSTNNAGAQPSVVAGGATETSEVDNRVEPLESSSSANGGDISLGSSAAESSTAPEDQEVSGKPSDGDEIEAISSEPATNAEPQSSPNDGPGGAPASEEAGTPEVSGTSEGSLAASAPESQAISSSNEEETSNTATNAGSQLPLDGESTAETPPPDGAEIAEASSSVPEEKGPLSPSTPESLEDSSSAKEVETASRKSTTDEGSPLSADGTSPEDSLASEGAEPTESHSIASGDEASPVPSATELQLPETSANENVLGGLENGESSLSPGKEIANAGSSSNNAGSQTSPDSVATEGEETGTSQDNSIVSKKQLSLAPSSTEPQSPGTSVSKDVSENLVNGEPALSTDGGKDTANIGTAGAQAPTSFTGTGPNQNNIAEQFGQNSESISGQPSADGAMIAKSPEDTSISSSVSSDGNLATQGTSQDFGAPDSSQPSSDIQGNLANSINAGRTEDSLLSLGDHTSISDTLDVPEGPVLDAKAGGEVLQGVSEALATVNNLIHPSSTEGTKPAAGQLLGVTSPLAFLPPKNGLLLASPNLGGPKLGNVVGKGSSPSTPEEQSEVVNSILEVHKGISTASSADGGQPSPLGAKGSPAKVSKLVPGKPGPQEKSNALLLSSKPEVPAKASKLASGKPGLQGKADAPQLSSKPEVPEETPQLPSGKSELQLTADTHLLSFNSDVVASSERALPGKPGPASSESTSASDESDRDSSSSTNLSEERQSFMKGKVALDLSKAKSGKSEPGVHLALSGVGLLAIKSSEPTGKTAKKKSDSKKSDSKKSKDKKPKRDEKPAVITGAPSGAAVSLYPYGASVNDKQYVERKVDFNSPLFKPEIGVPLGKTLRSSLYFTDNGQFVFPASDRDISSYPNPPSGGFNGREEVAMLAVFWDNADFSKGSGTIFYQEYPCGNSAKPALVQDVEAKIRQHVNSSYRARWLLKVTWDKVQRYPAQRQTSKTNTYQAILTTDGYRTYALFLYQDGGMRWDYTKLSTPNVLIGYTSGDGYFKNDNLMIRTPAEKYRPDGFRGYNTDVRGLWIYKLDSWIRVNYRQRCLDWLGHERFPSAWNRNLLPCPCSLQQGMSDNRYAISQKGGENSGLILLYSSSPNNYGAGVRCLYNRNGQLQEGRQERIWKKSRRNYPNNDEELKLHDWCCNKAGNPLMCEKYDQKRPRISCQGYKPPIYG